MQYRMGVSPQSWAISDTFPSPFVFDQATRDHHSNYEVRGDGGKDCVMLKRGGKVDAGDCSQALNVICIEDGKCLRKSIYVIPECVSTPFHCSLCAHNHNDDDHDDDHHDHNYHHDNHNNHDYDHHDYDHHYDYYNDYDHHYDDERHQLQLRERQVDRAVCLP